MPTWPYLAKLSILILEEIIKKISYERRDYESVDGKRRKKNSGGKWLSQKTTKIRIQEVKGCPEKRQKKKKKSWGKGLMKQ